MLDYLGCNMDIRTKPDFKKWALSLVDKEDAMIALEAAYNQGYAAGLIDEKIKSLETMVEKRNGS